MNEAYNRDCLEAMKEYPDGFFDLCVADPPYGIKVTSRHRERERESKLVGGDGRPFGGMRKLRQGQATDNGGVGKGARSGKKLKVEPKFYPVFDDSSPPDEGTFRELQRVSKKLIIWGGNYFLDYLGRATCMIVWDKKRRGMSQADCEIAWTNLPGQSRIFEWRWNGMLQQDMKHKEKRIHATQKPVALYKYLFSTYCKEGDRILDPYLGSGSSRIAAYDLGYDFVGYEIEKVYFDLQEKRFAEHTGQTSLFTD